jgi:hypothetical protein
VCARRGDRRSRCLVLVLFLTHQQQETGDVLHYIDFHQLQIENKQVRLGCVVCRRSFRPPCDGRLCVLSRGRVVCASLPPRLRRGTWSWWS